MAAMACAGAMGGLLLELFFVDDTAATSARGASVVLLCQSTISATPNSHIVHGLRRCQCSNCSA